MDGERDGSFLFSLVFCKMKIVETQFVSVFTCFLQNEDRRNTIRFFFAYFLLFAKKKVSYWRMVMPRMRSTPRRILAAALSASSTVSVWSAARRVTLIDTLFLFSPSFAASR